MRPTRLALSTLLLVVIALPVMAQTASTTGSSFNLSWAALDPGNDWAAQVIRNVFPISGSGGISTTQTTVIGQMIGQLTGFVAAIALAFVCYSTLMQIYRGAETSRLLGQNMTGMLIPRLGFAAIMMFPIPSVGFSVGQAAVVQLSLYGVGMAKAVYTNAVKAIGPDAMVVAQPMVPGTETIVLGLMKSELCRSLANAASNTINAETQLVPEPTATAVGSSTAPMTILAYNLSAGNMDSTPACGTIEIPAPKQNTPSLAGVPVDQSAIQQTALTTVLKNDIATQVQQVANNLFQTHQAVSLQPLMGILTNATRDYQTQLSTAATNITQQLRSALQSQNAAAALSNSSANQTQLSALGWTAAGAYYLEFAKLNAQTLSLLSAVPQVTPPSYDGFGPSLSSDLAPLVQSSQAYMTTLSNYVTTQDGLTAPGGQGDLFSGATPGEDGSSLIDQIFRRLHLSDSMLQTLQGLIAPTGNNWADPFSGLMALGDAMITIAVSAMGLAALAASGTASAATTAFEVLTGNFVGAGVTMAAHSVVSFLGTPIFILLLGLLIPGLTIAFVLPMVPWVMWMAGVMGWLILVCEAVIAVPLWMLAHMTMQGEGLHGNAREGYGLIFNVVFRPTLMLFGLFLGYFVFSSMSWLIRQTFGIAAGFVLEHGNIVTNVLGLIVLLSNFVMTHLVAALTAFRMISLVPHHVPQLLGFHGAGRVDMDQFSRDAAVAGVGGAMRMLNRGMKEGMEAASQKALALEAPLDSDSDSRDHFGKTNSSDRSPTRKGMDTTTRSTSDIPPWTDGET